MGKPSQQVRTYLCGLTCLVIASHDLVELYRSMVNCMCSQRGILTFAYRSLFIGLPLCWKAFLKNTTLHQQHRAWKAIQLSLNCMTCVLARVLWGRVMSLCNSINPPPHTVPLTTHCHAHHTCTHAGTISRYVCSHCNCGC